MTYRIHLTGIVQGVGFRQLVYNLARKRNICGTVSNSTAGMEIVFNAASETEANAFYQCILDEAPSKSHIMNHQMQPQLNSDFSDFKIIDSPPPAGSAAVMLTPDFALCDSCRAEMKDSTNRRYQYSFISCVQCGPRYSIIRKLPYDRHQTTMRRFDQCTTCGSEYNDFKNRRFYEETNSCPECGIRMSLLLSDQVISGNELILSSTLDLLRASKIVAVKGIGGYLLLCDATHAGAIRGLRERKHRPTKPFAMLYPNANVLEEDAVISEEEWEALRSPAAPIVLVPLREHPKSEIQTTLIAPGLLTMGVMLPYSPLLEMIASGFQSPLVATSAGVSNSPIIYDDHQAMNALFSVADAVLVHNREIVIPQDDSVIRFTDTGRKVVIRRSRGLSPAYFATEPFPAKEILAMGAQQKSTVSLLHRENVYVSQNIGNMESAETEQHYQTIVQHLLRVTGAVPELILSDMDPDYASSGIGEQLAHLYQAPVEKVQHHRAHLAAVLSENSLLGSKERVLGVIWDGSGLGDDGHSWGSEFFLWEDETMSRVGHLEYFVQILGDKMAREPRLSALSVVGYSQHGLLTSRFTGQEWKLYSAVAKSDVLKTSSMGRLFDAVASLCGFLHKASYEGEAALLLEESASYFLKENSGYFETYPLEYINGNANTIALATEIVQDIRSGTAPAEVATKFHCTLVNMIRNVAKANQVRSLAFSGDVFQNVLLVGLIEKYLVKEFKLYFHKQLSPNDECISFGQLAYWKIHQNKNGLTDQESMENYLVMA